MAPVHRKPDGSEDHDWGSHLSVTLKEHVEARLASLEKSLGVAREDLDVRLEQARAQLEKRLEGMNEFRQVLRDQNSSFVTKSEHDIVMDRLISLELTRAELSGKASRTSVLVSVCIAVVGLLLSVISYFHKIGP
jgi:hypothetical protein